MILHIARFGSAIGTCHNHLFKHSWTLFLNLLENVLSLYLFSLPSPTIYFTLQGVACVLHIWWFCRQEDGFLHKIIGRSWKALNIVAWPIFTLEWPLVPCSACIRDSREPCHTCFTLHRKWETYMNILWQLYSLPIAELPYANWVNLCDIMVSKWLIQ